MGVMHQLDPQLPVVVKTGTVWEKGYAIATIDYSQDHDLLWVVGLDKTGEIMTVPNGEVRLQNNWSLYRRVVRKGVKDE